MSTSAATSPASRSSHRGRFAPSPTGPLHFGSLTTAVGSYLAAKTAGGEWHVRIDDLDRARTVPGAAEDILRTLDIFGFEWDGEVWYQSRRSPTYTAALASLERHRLVYACSCSRRELQLLAADQSGGQDPDELRYPGLCRQGPLAPERGTAVRFRVRGGAVVVDDGIQGRIEIDVQQEAGDFVIRRRDGLFAYQLACAVDDHEQGFTHIVRGADLLASTARQMLLQEALGYTHPLYAHLPVVVDATGQKLSKSQGSEAIGARPAHVLCQALRCLGQAPPADLQSASLPDVWRWAREHWTTEALLGTRAVAWEGSDGTQTG